MAKKHVVVTPDPAGEAEESLGSRILFVDVQVTQPAAGSDTGTVKVTVRDSKDGPAVAEAVRLELAVYDDADAVGPAATAAFAAVATAGQILYGASTAALKIKTTAAGYFECPVTDAADETVYVFAAQSAGSPVLNCSTGQSLVYAP